MLLNRIVPEIDWVVDRRMRAALAVRTLRSFWMTGPRGFVMGAALFLPSLFLADLAADLLGNGRPSVSWFVGFFAGTCVISQGLLIVLLRRHARRRIRMDLVALGLPRCIACGYDLTGNASGRCPECGTLCPCMESKP
jgi:hypothetical protein